MTIEEAVEETLTIAQGEAGKIVKDYIRKNVNEYFDKPKISRVERNE